MFIKNHYNKIFWLIRTFNLFLVFLSTSLSDAQQKKDLYIYIYNDVGVNQNSFKHIEHTLAASIAKDYNIKFINASQIKEGRWMDHAALLIIPGGADLPYTEKLNGKGNELIKQYVKNGGNYLGFCAGAYYGCGFIEFDKGGPLEVLGKRELSFFPGKCIGPAVAKYDYQSNKGARAVKIDSKYVEKDEFVTYYNGGGFFLTPEKYADIEIIGEYSDLQQPAIIMVKYGKGTVILSAVHFEYSYRLLDKNDIYLKKIINELKDSESARLQFFNKILKTSVLNLSI